MTNHIQGRNIETESWQILQENEDFQLPSLSDVVAARARIAPFISESPVREYEGIADEVGHGMRVFVKHENHLPTNSFKVRAGLSFVSALPNSEKARGVVCATRGNHGIGLAYAARTFGVRAHVFVPRGNNPEKDAELRRLGAQVTVDGEDYDDAVALAEAYAAQTGGIFVPASKHADVIAGAATLSLEFLEQARSLDAIVLAVGSGSALAGLLVVRAVMRPELRVFAVQAANAAPAYSSWIAGHAVETARPMTCADGIAARRPPAHLLQVFRENIEDFITVTEEELRSGVRRMLRITHNLSEGAGSASLAALPQLGRTLEGCSVGVVLTGSNIDAATLRQTIA